MPFTSPLAMKRPKIVKKQVLEVVNESFDKNFETNGKEDDSVRMENINVNIESIANSEVKESDNNNNNNHNHHNNNNNNNNNNHNHHNNNNNNNNINNINKKLFKSN